uniref:RPA-interacting protein C-terminal domain-containing protein n=1 Tax=Vitis vinifera TaxID=29760 RepID=A5ALM6_VITVI|nr:hypothetical protein VITISV_004631 [Vitis vinifera]
MAIMAQINVFPRALLWGFKTHRFVKPTPFSPFLIRSLDNRIPSSIWRVAMEKDEGRGRRLSIKDSQRRPPWLHKEFMESTVREIFSDELQRFRTSALSGCSEIPTSTAKVDEDMLWEYDGLHTASHFECEEVMLELQRMFYEDIRMNQTHREEEDEDYLDPAIFENLRLEDDKGCKEIWCPICKKGKLRQNNHLIYCTLCELGLERGDQVNLDCLQVRLGEAYSEHLDRGCRFTPQFHVYTQFSLTALYIQCEACKIFELIL